MSLTLAACYTLWRKARAHKRSLRADHCRWHNLTTYFGESRLLATITADDVEDFRSACMAKYTPGTTNRHLALLKAAFNLAIKRRLITSYNPVSAVDMLKETPRHRVCSYEEYDLLTRHAKGNLKTDIILGFNTGMRLGEICGLSQSDVRLNPNPHVLLTATKSGRARIIPLNATVMDYLSTTTLKPHDKYNISTRFGKLAKSLGILDLRFHDLRRSFVSQCRLANVPLATTQAITGHATPAVLLKTYSVVATDELTEAVNALDPTRLRI